MQTTEGSVGGAGPAIDMEISSGRRGRVPLDETPRVLEVSFVHLDEGKDLYLMKVVRKLG